MSEVPVIQVLRVDEAVMRSPTKFLWKRIQLPLRSLSPSFKQRFVESGARLQIQLYEQRRFRCGVVPSTGDLLISTGFLALLWACAHLNITYWDIRQNAGELGTTVQIDPHDHPRLADALKLLEWAMNHAMASSGTDEWPEDLPKPQPSESTCDEVTDQIMLRAMGFIFCHEIAHVMLRHSTGADAVISIEQEKDADRSAIDSYFDGCADPESGEYFCRAFGVVTAMFFAMLTGFFDGQWESTTHPPAWLRMDIVLGDLNLRDYHPAKVWASELKSLYLSLSGNQTGGRFPTPTESMQQLIEICSRGEVGGTVEN
jgi:hypothetical protein